MTTNNKRLTAPFRPLTKSYSGTEAEEGGKWKHQLYQAIFMCPETVKPKEGKMSLASGTKSRKRGQERRRMESLFQMVRKANINIIYGKEPFIYINCKNVVYNYKI